MLHKKGTQVFSVLIAGFLSLSLIPISAFADPSLSHGGEQEVQGIEQYGATPDNKGNDDGASADVEGEQLIPASTSDVEPAQTRDVPADPSAPNSTAVKEEVEASPSYEVTGDMTQTFSSLPDALAALNADEGTNYTVKVTGDDPNVTGRATVNAGKQVTLTSADGGPYRLTKTDASRHLYVYGSMTIKDLIFDGDNKGGGIEANGGAAGGEGRLTIEDGAVVTQCISNIGGCISLDEGANLVMNGGTVDHGSATFGGGVYVGHESTFVLNEGLISQNESTGPQSTGGGGGGVYVYVHGTFDMRGGTLSDNTAAYIGGGVYASERTNVSGYPHDWCLIKISGGTIDHNKADYGAGIAAQRNGIIEMTGGTITYNDATLGGGAVGLVRSSYKDYGTFFTMTDGELSHNTAGAYGGAVWISDQDKYLTGMAVGEADGDGLPRIFDNHAGVYGGGIMVHSTDKNVTAVLNRGLIYGNSAEQAGGGVGVLDGGKFEMFDGVIGDETPNTAVRGGGIAAMGADSEVLMHQGAILNNQATENGGGMYVAAGSSATLSGLLRDNVATENGGGAYVEGENLPSRLADPMSAGRLTLLPNAEVKDNSAGAEGGGIFTEDYEGYDSLTPDDYQNIHSDSSTVFSGNTADAAYAPPAIADQYTNIGFATSSIVVDGAFLNPINNYDINYNSHSPLSLVTVTYDANGGTGSLSDQAAQGADYSVLGLAATGIERDGYDFLGWNDRADGSGTAYAAGDKTTIQGDMTLYAQWKKQSQPPEPPVAPDNPDNPDNPGDQPLPPAQEESPSLESPSVLPQTGDSVSVVGIALAGLAAAAVALYAVRRLHRS